jgi:hypothetical protein
VTDWLWRFPSAIVGTLAVAVTYRLGSAWFGRGVGLSGAMLLAVSPVAVRYSQEARMHELFLLLAALSTWMLNRALTERPGRRRLGWWLAYSAATAASLYTVYLGFVVLAVQGVWVAIRCLRGRHAASPWQVPLYFATSVALAFAAYVPWWPALIDILQQRIQLRSVESSASVGSAPLFAMRAIESLGPTRGWAAWLGLLLWAIGLASVGRRKLDLSVLGGLWLLLPLGFSVAFRDPRAQHMRYAFVLPVYLIFAAEGTSAVARSLSVLVCRSRVRSPCAVRWQHDNPEVPWNALSRCKRDLHMRVFAVAVAALVAISALCLPAYYDQAKTGWRMVAAYLIERARPGDVIITDGLFDAGRYLGYYYRGPAELASPAVLVASLPERLPGMRASGGRVWAVTRFEPRPIAATRPVAFPGLIVSEPLVPVYEPEILTASMIDLMQQAVAAAPDWAARMSAEGIMEPDPRVARAASYLYLGDVLLVAGRVPEAIAAYEAMVADDPDPAAGYVTLAEAYQAAGRHEAAVNAYQQAVMRQPRWQCERADAAAALAAAGQWAMAAAAYQAIISPQQSEP